MATSKTNAQYAYISPYFVQSKQVAWEYLKRYGQQVIVKSNESELWVDVPCGSGTTSRIFLFGADNPNRLRGLFLDGCILDEYADMRPSVWGEVIRPMLADRKGWAVFIGTPKGHNAFYDIHKQASSDSSWFSLMLRASQSGLLDAKELAEARKGMTDDQYAQEFECSFEAAIHGAVYGKWMSDAEAQGRIRSIPYDPTLPVHTAWDLGYDDATSIWFHQIAFKELRLIDYYESHGEDISHYCGVLKSKPYQYGKHWVPHDAANKLFAAGGRSIVEQARLDHKVTMHVVPATGQQNAIEATRKTLECSYFDRERCDEGIEALKQYQFEYDEERKVFRSKPRHDWSSHAADAFEVIAQTWRAVPKPDDGAPWPPKPPTINQMLSHHIRNKNRNRDDD